MRIIVAFCLSGLIGVSLGVAPVPKDILKKFPDYYPLLPGTEWEYGTGDLAIIVKVEDYEKKDGVRTGKLVTYANGKDVAFETIRIDDTGVYRTHINDTKIEPAILLLNFGIKDETEWATKCKVGEAKIDFKFKLEGLVELEVPTGKYQAVKVTGTGDVAGTKTNTEYHFAEGVGIIRLGFDVGGSGTVLSLKKYTAGKEPKK